MALKSPYDPEDQIYEHLVQLSDSAILPEELPAMYLLPSLPVRHQGQRETCAAFTGASIAEYHFLSIGQLLPSLYTITEQPPAGCMEEMCLRYYKKKGISTEDKFSYGTTKRPNDEVYQLAPGRRLSSFSRIHTIDRAKHVLIENGLVFIALPLYNSSPTFWKSNSDLPHDFHAVSIEGYDSNGFFFRNSWGTDWGNNGCGYLPFINCSWVVEAWVGVSQRSSLDSCQPLQNHRRMSVYGNARRYSVAGTVAPSTQVTESDKVRPWYVKLLQCVRSI